MHKITRELAGTILALSLLAGSAAPGLAQDETEAPEATPVPETASETEEELAEPETEAPDDAPDIDFGDDASEWDNDGECDDPRFTGTGMAEVLEDADLMHDATDCRAAFEAGTISLAEPEDVDEGDIADTATPAEIDFGDDSGGWPNDQECDDPRFVGTAMASELDESNILGDATDCRNAFEDGSITLSDGTTSDRPAGGTSAAWLEAIADRIDFGDDGGDWPNDDECDDPDFTGPGAVSDPDDINRKGDATDCRAAFVAGTVTLRSTGTATGFSYGTDFSEWADDGECDDPRFTGTGMAKKLSSDDIEGDASDCRMLESEGAISIIEVYQPDFALGAPYDSSGVEFGDDSSSYANDELCDDPRFVGPGTAFTLLDSDRMADATDCRAAFEDGTIMLRDDAM